MRFLRPLAFASFGTFLAIGTAGAQASETLPAGYGANEGESYHWSGWANSTVYLPARNFYFYANPFKTAKTINRLALRRDSGITSAFVAHKKSVRWYLSTDGCGTATQPVFDFRRIHGKDVKMVVGTTASPATVDFKATLVGGGPAPFDVSVALNAPFVVPTTAETIHFENRHYGPPIGTNGTWWPDAYYVNSAINPGSGQTIGQACVPNISLNSFMTGPNGLMQTWADGMAANIPVVAILGTRLPTPIPIPGTMCTLYVNPIVFVGGASDAAGRMDVVWGKIPDDPKLIGSRIGFQYVPVFAGGPVGNVFGFSAGYEVAIGSGYARQVEASAVYSYGTILTRDGGPDKAVFAANFAPRAPILEIK